ncbi:MAG: chemotaxis protein CheR [Deltaproteobacteria bacterium]|jgi:chemotaxis methyl-accepting protein methylase|nr:chemotaxis protein CheR [Deltaproteobacteria bacterium]
MDFDQFLKQACPPQDLIWRKYRRRAARHRVQARIKELGLPGLPAYLERLRSDPQEGVALANLMRITVSRFFRDRPSWEALGQSVLPNLLEKKAAGQPLRIWSAGCCGGEEPYTLALLWQNTFSHKPVDILATDIDQDSLARAHQATYTAGSLREVPRHLLEQYFRQAEDRWVLDDQIKRLVRFEQCDLMETPVAGPMDVICCRYLAFTYYTGRRLNGVIHHFWTTLNPGGALMIGRKEVARITEVPFDPWPDAPGVFRKR